LRFPHRKDFRAKLSLAVAAPNILTQTSKTEVSRAILRGGILRNNKNRKLPNFFTENYGAWHRKLRRRPQNWFGYNGFPLIQDRNQTPRHLSANAKPFGVRFIPKEENFAANVPPKGNAGSRLPIIIRQRRNLNSASCASGGNAAGFSTARNKKNERLDFCDSAHHFFGLGILAVAAPASLLYLMNHSDRPLCDK